MSKVLIVDDDAWLAASYELVLQKHGWQVATAQTAAAAIDMIDDFAPDVILLDFMLPYASAPALLNELQSHSDLSIIPVVICSSLDFSAAQKQALRAYGVQAILQKTTLTPALIVSTIEVAAHAIA